MEIFVRELAAGYRAARNGTRAQFARHAMDMATFAQRDRERLRGERAALRRYWRDRLAGAQHLELPADRPRAPTLTYAGGFAEHVVPRAVLDRVDELARGRRSSPFMVLAAVFLAQLRRRTGADDLVIGTPADGRTVPGADAIVGYFVNMLPLRVDCSGDPPGHVLIDRVRDATLDAYAHQGLPFAEIVSELRPVRMPGRPPVFSTTVHLKRAEQLQVQLDGCTVGDFQWLSPLQSRYDLSLDLNGMRDGLAIRAEYNARRWDAASIDAVLAEYACLLERFLDKPSARISDL